MKDIRECYVWLEYTDGHKVKLPMLLDIDDCVERQIRESFESPSPEGKKLADFKWDLAYRHQTIHNEEYS